jgi:hypothetical protein
MKKIVTIILVACIALFALVGCATEEEKLSAEIVEKRAELLQLEKEVATLAREKTTLRNEILDTKVENGTAKYVVTFNISQSHFTLDLSQHLKDAMNDISIQVPVDKEYYDSVRVGDTIDDSFRMGSFIFKGSFGNWKITVEDKCIQ